MNAQQTSLEPVMAGTIAELALAGIHREYPNKIAHVMHGDADALPPRELTPIFFGCFDWHSAVHSHWCLVRLLRFLPDEDWSPTARNALRASFTAEKIDGERRYLTGPDREGFERPYGLAWLLQLAAELREWDDLEGREWVKLLSPLETIAAERFRRWLPKLSHSIRTGEHSQTAFAMGLVFDWAVSVGDDAMRELIIEQTLRFHSNDENAPLHLEPSGHDFLSPSLAAADLMRRAVSAEKFAGWLSRSLPQIPVEPNTDWLPPATVTDPTDGKLAHLHGLNLSRAWMLEGIAAALPSPRAATGGDSCIAALQATAKSHREAGLPAVTGEHYSISHWLGSFAVYLLTERGL